MYRRALCAVFAIATFCIAQACSPARAQDLEIEVADEFDVGARRDEDRSTYRARLAALEAAAQVGPPIDEVLTSFDDPFAPVLKAVDDGCGEGEVLWHRDLDISFCARLCSDHADCVVESDLEASEPTELCAALDVGFPPDGITIGWENVEMPGAKVALGLCDPFWPENPTIGVDGAL